MRFVTNCFKSGNFSKVLKKSADILNVIRYWGKLMNEYYQNSKVMKQELEALLSGGYKSPEEVPLDIVMFCEMMKQAYLSCSTNN